MRSSHILKIAVSLTQIGDWQLASNIKAFGGIQTCSVDGLPIKDVWLKSRFPGPRYAEYLRLWPEKLYLLLVDCKKKEIPDMCAWEPILPEDEYYHDPLERFGPPRLPRPRGFILPPSKSRSVVHRQDIPMFVPTIEAHLKAVADQVRAERKIKDKVGKTSDQQLNDFILYLFLDWEPNREWVLGTKVRERKQQLVHSSIGLFRRKPMTDLDPITKKILSRLPWELPPKDYQIVPPEMPGSCVHDRLRLRG